MTQSVSAPVFRLEHGLCLPSGLSRGPWDDNAQHGGAAAALLAHVAETEAGPAFFLARLTVELSRPIPIAPIRVSGVASQGHNTRRVDLTIEEQGEPVGRAVALMLREQPVTVPEAPDQRLTPGPEASEARFETPGMPQGQRFHDQAMEIRVARGTTREPGPAAAWLRPRCPLIEGTTTSGAMRAAAAADFGNGLSWVLSFEDYLFANTDLTLYLHRAPVGEWIGVEAETIVQAQGIGLTSSTLFDTHGPIGKAQQNLLIRAR